MKDICIGKKLNSRVTRAFALGNAAKPVTSPGRKENNMTIKTLTFIHELLKDEVNRLNGAYSLAAEASKEAEEAEAPNAKPLDELKMQMFRKRTEAQRVLDEFEAQEW